MTGLGRLLLLSFLPIRCVRSRSLCGSSVSNFSLKISRARSSAFSWFPSVFQWIRKQFFEIPFLFHFLIPNVIDSLTTFGYKMQLMNGALFLNATILFLFALSGLVTIIVLFTTMYA